MFAVVDIAAADIAVGIEVVDIAVVIVAVVIVAGDIAVGNVVDLLLGRMMEDNLHRVFHPYFIRQKISE